MRVPSFPMIASFALLAAPALAQTSGMTGGQLSDVASSSRPPPDTVVTLDTQQKLKQSLEQNGFKNVVVVPEAYIVHAQAPDGSKIVMEVSPIGCRLSSSGPAARLGRQRARPADHDRLYPRLSPAPAGERSARFSTVLS